jgi:hypothetical protein
VCAGTAAAALIAALLPAHTSGLDCLLLDQLALADGLLASAPGLPAAPSTHHAPVGLRSTGGCCTGRCSRPAHRLSLAGLNHCANPHRFCCRGLGPRWALCVLGPRQTPCCATGGWAVRSLLLI